MSYLLCFLFSETLGIEKKDNRTPHLGDVVDNDELFYTISFILLCQFKWTSEILEKKKAHKNSVHRFSVMVC